MTRWSLLLQTPSSSYTTSWDSTSIHPGVVATGRYVQQPAQDTFGVVEPQFFHHRVPGSDSLAKYAAAFFNMSRSIFTSANSFFVRARSISTSVNGLYVLPTSPSLPALYAFTQYPNVDGGKDNLT